MQNKRTKSEGMKGGYLSTLAMWTTYDYELNFGSSLMWRVLPWTSLASIPLITPTQKSTWACSDHNIQTIYYIGKMVQHISL